MSKSTNLNHLENSKLLKNDREHSDLTKAKIINPVTDRSNLIREANKLGYNPKNLDLRDPEKKALEIKNDLMTAKSFGELDGKLSKNDLWIDKKNDKVVFTDGFSNINATAIDTDFKLDRLQRNFGEDFSKYLKVRNDGIDMKNAENKVQIYFDQEIVKDIRTTKKDVKSKIEEIRYELAAIQTSPKQTRNTARKETLLAQKSKLIKKHKNLTAEIASLDKKGRLGSGIDHLKSRANHIKSKASRLGESASLVKRGYKINKHSIDGMTSARKLIGIQQAFKNKVAVGAKLPSKLASLKMVAKPSVAIAYKAYSTLQRMANDPEMSR